MAEVLERKPFRTYLKERETLIPRKKLVDILGIDPSGYMGYDFWDDVIKEFAQEVPPPIIDRVRPEEAIDIIARSAWAHSLAEGVCGPGYVGLTPGTPEYERCVYNVSHRAAAKAYAKGIFPVAPPPRPPRRR